jgi:D-alanyl-lipoteichoic acid acyltransferase DltB (MBOAT superfamily)
VLDVYREINEKPEKDFGYYLLYVSFFPMILAGPIVKSEHFLSQLNQPKPITEPQIGLAFFWIIEGLFKKIVIADFLAANYINRIFDAPQMFTGLECLTASIFYGVHLYYDFSGYTDMAKGMAMLFGLDIGINFNEPFKAQNISDFWRRWHISVSTWFNDYVHFPLSMSLRAWGKKGIILSVIVTFVLSGLWHGPAWTFVLWGFMHGLAIAWDVYSQNYRLTWKKSLPSNLYTYTSIFLTQLFLFATYMVFKNSSLENLGLMLIRIRDEFHADLLGRWIEQYGVVLWVWLAGMVLHWMPLDWKKRLENTFIDFSWYVQLSIIVFSVIMIYQIKVSSSLPFVYLQF